MAEEYRCRALAELRKALSNSETILKEGLENGEVVEITSTMECSEFPGVIVVHFLNSDVKVTFYKNEEFSI